MKNILYATDCSKHDTHTLQYAVMMSDMLNVKLTVLHIFSLPPIGVSTIRPKKYLSKHAHEEKLVVLKEYCSSHINNVGKEKTILYEVIEDDSVSNGILEATAAIAPDVLIVGMKDEHTTRGSFTGSIAKALIEKVAAPLLIVPSATSFKKIKTVVYATDYEEADVLALKRIVQIVEPFNTIIKIVHINTEDQNKVKDNLEWFKEMLFKITSYRNITFDIILSDSVYEGLRTYIDNTNADMIALLEREESGFVKKLFHTDLIKKMESKIDIPMLSINEKLH